MGAELNQETAIKKSQPKIRMPKPTKLKMLKAMPVAMMLIPIALPASLARIVSPEPAKLARRLWIFKRTIFLKLPLPLDRQSLWNNPPLFDLLLEICVVENHGKTV